MRFINSCGCKTSIWLYCSSTTLDSTPSWNDNAHEDHNIWLRLLNSIGSHHCRTHSEYTCGSFRPTLNSIEQHACACQEQREHRPRSVPYACKSTHQQATVTGKYNQIIRLQSAAFKQTNISHYNNNRYQQSTGLKYLGWPDQFTFHCLFK